jgi:hypothetical protein
LADIYDYLDAHATAEDNRQIVTVYRVTKDRLPLPHGPIAEGHPPRELTIGVPEEFVSEADAMEYARKLVQEGYGITLIHPDGREWSRAEILRRLNT